MEPDDLCRLYEALEGDRDPDPIRQSLARVAEEGGTLAQVMVAALESDGRIRAATWLDLVNGFDPLLTTDEAITVIREWGRRHQLEGPPSSYHLPLGRAVELEAFCSHLTSYGHLTMDGALDLVADLLDESTWVSARERCRKLGLEIGKHVIWATFHPTGGDPFDFAGTLAEVERNLGLQPADSLSSGDPRGRSLLLLTYEPVGIVLRFPTCAEAGSSDPWSYYFQPAPTGAPWGMTKAWGDMAATTTYKPELVHEPLPLSLLTRSLDERTNAKATADA